MPVNHNEILVCLFLKNNKIVPIAKIKFNKTDNTQPVIITNSLKACGIVR